MNNICNIPADKLPFHLFGLCLQEPMSIILNWVIALVSVIIYFKLSHTKNDYQKNWRYFFLIFAFSTFFGGLGHAFYFYAGFYGKIPSWILSIISAIFVGKAMINVEELKKSVYSGWLYFIYIATFVLIIFTLAFESFTFVLIDTIIIYFTFCMGFGIYYWKKGKVGVKYTVFGVLTLIPSAFVFIFKINPYLWFNTNDLSHLIIIISLFFFYFGAKRFEKNGLLFNDMELEDGRK